MFNGNRIGLVGLTMVFVLGCGSGDTREYGKLSGMVTLNGQPAPTGTIISFLNPESGAATSAQVLEGGKYAVHRAVTGIYSVAFVPQGGAAVEIDDPDVFMQQIASGTYKEPKIETTIPKRFHTAESSGLTVEVKTGENTHDFQL